MEEFTSRCVFTLQGKCTERQEAVGKICTMELRCTKGSPRPSNTQRCKRCIYFTTCTKLSLWLSSGSASFTCFPITWNHERFALRLICVSEKVGANKKKARTKNIPIGKKKSLTNENKRAEERYTKIIIIIIFINCNWVFTRWQWLFYT